MNRPSRKAGVVGVPTPSVRWRVKFGKEPRCRVVPLQGKPLARVPRVARLLALAHRIDGMIRAGELKDWAEAARMIGVTRARMTQIGNLMLLTPEIQEQILDMDSIPARHDPVTERDLRFVVTKTIWTAQQIESVVSCYRAQKAT